MSFMSSHYQDKLLEIKEKNIGGTLQEMKTLNAPASESLFSLSYSHSIMERWMEIERSPAR